MADITRTIFWHHLRSGPTSWIRHGSSGAVRKEGVGLTFWFRAGVAVLSEVPVDDRELSLVCHARTVDHAELSVPVGITHRIAEPGRAASRLDFGIDPRTGRWRGAPLDTLATLLGELAQQPVLALLAGSTLQDALAAGPDPVQRAIEERLADDERLADLGVVVVGVRVLAVRAAPDLERALQTPTREAAQASADRATYQRRADAVERERVIAENELQSKIELARREEQLVAQRGENVRRKAELDAAAALVAAEAGIRRDQLAAEAEAARNRVVSAAQAEALRIVGLAEAAAEAAKMDVVRDLPPGVLTALAMRELAGHLPEIGQLTITPDVLTGLVTRLGTTT
ncbi:SPFH domain-containing protein [Pseudonocardia sp. TRM90224]|uniref:SPFH domain-containing protein n=1 Tax=Pseudonocardia sp. TRM90224 TaxID=2812678 RepID=UPI001E4BDEDE|nr:SPFH domain-containing protein [Pseudonocardia sp. TRM90224]